MRVIDMKVAKRSCDSDHLTLEVAALASKFVHIKVERVAANKFEIKAWERILE